MNRSNNINLNEVENFLHSRKKGIIDIGILFHESNDYKAAARSFIEKHYAFISRNRFSWTSYKKDPWEQLPWH